MKERKETDGGDQRAGAGAGDKSGKVTIEARGSGAGINATAPPATLDQALGTCARRIRGEGKGRLGRNVFWWQVRERSVGE